VIYLLTQHANLTVNGQSEGILVVLVIGREHRLRVVAYRQVPGRNCAGHADRHEAMAVALRRGRGPAIIASGLTVVAGMLLPARGPNPTTSPASARSPRLASPWALIAMVTLAAGGPRDLRPVGSSGR